MAIYVASMAMVSSIASTHLCHGTAIMPMSMYQVCEYDHSKHSHSKYSHSKYIHSKYSHSKYNYSKYLGELDGDLELDEVRRWEIARAHCTWGQQYVVMVRVRVRVRGTSSPSEHVR